jgi:imidazolonepropionase-like amidohydrolase
MRLSSPIAVLALPASLVAQQTPATGTVVLKAARLIDGTGAPVIDLDAATLLPGFIDAHVHLIGRPLSDPKSDDVNVRDYPSYGWASGRMSLPLQAIRHATSR